MVKNKAQMKIQQTAFMLLALTLFFVLVGLFVLGMRMNSLRDSASLLEEKNALLLVSKLANSPEFSCGDSYGNGITDCIDADKAIMLKEDSEKYKDFWGVSDIKIRKLYPKMQGDVSCTLENYPNCNIIELRQGRVSGDYVSNFVSLCRKQAREDYYSDKCEIGLLMVSYEKK